MVHNQRGLWGLDQCAECEPGPAGRCRQWVELTSVDAEEPEEPAPPAGSDPQRVVDFDAVEIEGEVKRQDQEKKQEQAAAATEHLRNGFPRRHTGHEREHAPEPGGKQAQALGRTRKAECRPDQPLAKPPQRQARRSGPPRRRQF